MKEAGIWKTEARRHLEEKLLPFWKNLKDEEYGGFYGLLSYELELDKRAVKGCILNSRILWFFSNCAMQEALASQRQELLAYAAHAYRFLREACYDWEQGGVYWSVTYDGKPEDDTKHTYNQAFAVYALASYYAASGEEEALTLATSLYHLIEERCTDAVGYLEAFTRTFEPEENDKLSENGVIAQKTMNTLLHVFEAYTELSRVLSTCVEQNKARQGEQVNAGVGADKSALLAQVNDRLRFMLGLIADKIYNPQLHRQEVFFDAQYNSILDLHSYGHDIETAWLVDRGLEVLADEALTARLRPITAALTARIYERAYRDSSLLNECERGADDTTRIWWVQAEAVIGFLNGWQKEPEQTRYYEAAADIFTYILRDLVDPRAGSEWYWALDENRKPLEKPIVEPWKCPYHNGRMCMELLQRL